jgi:protease IV
MKHEPYIQTLVKLSLKIIVVLATVSGMFTVLGVIGAAGVMFLIGVAGSAYEPVLDQTVYGSDSAAHTFVSIPIHGVIVGSASDVEDPFGLFSSSVTYGYSIKDQLRQLAFDADVDGVILDINSPGGTIYGANAIADGVKYYQDTAKKPVYAFVSGIAASGAYWAAAATDKIIADVGTGVGSIGVISGPYQFYDGVISEDGGAFAGGVVTQRGIQTTYITAGTSKDLGNPYRRMTKEEVRSLQTMVDTEYDTFVSFVSLKRNIPKQVITDVLGAMVYDPKQAKLYDMIDDVQNREDTYTRMASDLSLPVDDFRVVETLEPIGFIETLLSAQRVKNTTPNLCHITKTHLVYYGNVAGLCQ